MATITKRNLIFSTSSVLFLPNWARGSVPSRSYLLNYEVHAFVSGGAQYDRVGSLTVSQGETASSDADHSGKDAKNDIVVDFLVGIEESGVVPVKFIIGLPSMKSNLESGEVKLHINQHSTQILEHALLSMILTPA